MHARQSAKLQALNELGAGARDYKTFQKAASFGHIHADDFVRIKGYEKGLRWAHSCDTDPSSTAKDHRLSRKWAYDNHAVVKNCLTPELAISLMQYAVKYGINMQPRHNHTLCLMAVICGHHANAEILSVQENSKKGARCSLDIKELCNLIAEHGNLNYR
jgi:hypothetical protein